MFSILKDFLMLKDNLIGIRIPNMEQYLDIHKIADEKNAKIILEFKKEKIYGKQ